MSTEKTNETSVEEVVSKPKVRRGIGTARGTTRMKFDTKHALPNGLFLAHLENVEVRDITIGEETSGMPSFNGLTIPQLVLTFASNEEDANKRKYAPPLRFSAVESNAETIPGGKGEWKVNQIFDYIKHILNVYVLKGRELNETEEEALALSFEDFDEEGNYIPTEPEVVIAAWRQLFTNFATIMNTGRDGSPVYKTKDNKFIPVYVKLIRYFKANKSGWKAVSNGDLAFPTFVGEGVIEIYKQNVPASIRIDAIREDIRPRQIAETKKPNMPAGPGMTMMGGIPMMGSEGGIVDPMAGPDGIALEAGEDTPF